MKSSSFLSVNAKALGFFVLSLATTINASEIARTPSHPYFQTLNPNVGASLNTIAESCAAHDLTIHAKYKNFKKSGTKKFLKSGPFNFQNKKFEVMLHVHADVKAVPRPLIIVVPGIFSEISNPYATQLALPLWNSGYNVAVVQNAWAETFVSASNFEMGDTQKESDTLLWIISQIKNHFQQKGILQKTHLLAYSYGAFTSGNALAADSEKSNSLVDGKALLISPPHDFKTTFSTMNKYLQQSHSISGRPTILSLIQARGRICKAAKRGVDFSTYFSVEELQSLELKAQYMIATFMFSKRLAASARNLESRLEDAQISTNDEWKNLFFQSPDFSSYIRAFVPHSAKIFAQQVPLSDVLFRRELTRPGRTLTVVSDNDFINPYAAWRKSGSSRHVINLKQGGHVTFMFSNWGHSLLKKFYGIQ